MNVYLPSKVGSLNGICRSWSNLFSRKEKIQGFIESVIAHMQITVIKANLQLLQILPIRLLETFYWHLVLTSGLCTELSQP